MSRTPNTPAEGPGRRGPGALRRIAASRDAKMTLVLALVVVAALVLVPRFGQPRTLTFLTLDVAATLLMALPMTLVRSTPTSTCPSPRRPAWSAP